MEKPESLIGRKIKGFRFEGNKYARIGYLDDMDKFIGQPGQIMFADHVLARIKFDSDKSEWNYPINLIESHLIPEETNSPNKAMTAVECLNKTAQNYKYKDWDDLHLKVGGREMDAFIVEAMHFYHSQQSQAEQKELVELKRKVEELEAELNDLKTKIKLSLPDDCIVPNSEIKFCQHRLSGDGMCKYCID